MQRAYIYCKQVLTIYEDQIGSKHPDYVNTLHNLEKIQQCLYLLSKLEVEFETFYARSNPICETQLLNMLNCVASNLTAIKNFKFVGYFKKNEEFVLDALLSAQKSVIDAIKCSLEIFNLSCKVREVKLDNFLIIEFINGKNNGELIQGVQ